ncbi:glycosyltransferase family 2 protein, partial [Escherichia coli]
MELVSIIIAAYNCKDTIYATVESALSQTYKNIEIIICDDSSTDDTWDIINKIKDSRIICIKNNYCKGAAGARNCALKIAKGRYIAFLDSDDYWVTTKISNQIHFMETEKVFFSYSNYYIEKDFVITGVFSSPPEINYGAMLKYCNIACSTVILDRTGVKNISFPYIDKEDYALWLNILSKGIKARNTNLVDTYYRVHAGSVSANKFKELIRQSNVLKSIGI